MKTIYRVACAELRSLFCSPVAWLILVIFAVQAGVAFANSFDRQVQAQALGYDLWDVTASIFTGWMGIFPSFLSNLYLYIPLLTMGLMSREYSSGSIKLLFSSPVTNSQIILGKYTSVLIYNLVLLMPLFIMAIFCGAVVKDVDMGLILTGILGMYLLICAYAAIGLFMSSITSYQVVAAMGTLAILGVLNYIGEIGQDYAFIRDITYWLSISGRAHEFINGLICSEDLIYFILIITLFITLSILKLRSTRSKISRQKSWSIYGAVILVALTIGYASTLPSMKVYYDATTTKRNTLTQASQQIVNQLEGGLKITTYVNLLDANYTNGIPRNLKNDFERFEQYTRFKPEIEMDYVYYWQNAGNADLDFRLKDCKTDQERAETLCRIMKLDYNMFMTPDEITEYMKDKDVDLAAEGYHFIRVIERENGQKNILRMFNDIEKHPSETEISAAMKSFLVESPKVAFVTGHEMRDISKSGDRDYNHFAQSLYFRHSLVNQGFEVETLSLEEKDVPENIDILVIAEPRSAFTTNEMNHLSNYIARGGNLFILGDARRQPILNPLIAPLGVQLMPGTLVEMKANDSPSLVIGHITAEAAQMSSPYVRPHRFDFTITMPDAVGLSFDPSKGFTSHPMIVTSPKCWNELQTTDFLDEKPQWDASTGEVQASFTTVLGIKRMVGDKEQRIVISGDADCVSNGEMNKSRNGYSSNNFNLIPGTFKWLSYDEYPLDTSRPQPQDDAVSVTREYRKAVRYAWYTVIPTILFITGMTIRIRRKRR